MSRTSTLCRAASVLLVAAMGGLSACTMQITAPMETPPESWDPALNTHPNGAAFQGLLDRYVHDGIPGVVLYVRTPDGLWNGAAGYARIEAAEAMTPTHRHHAASVTKMYMATAVLLLAEENVIELDTAISEYLPDSICTRAPNCADATVRQLLNHTSGIPDFSGNFAYDLDFLNDPFGSYPPERLLSYLYGQSSWSSPGEHCFYSNANYYLLALMLDQIVQGGHSSVVSERILRPLGLDATYYKLEAGYPAPPGLVNSYEDVAGDGRLINVTDMAIHDADIFMGNAGLMATSADFAAFLDALLGGQIVDHESLSEMQDWWETSRYGLGLDFIETPYGPGIGHTGGDFGTMSQVRYFPDHDATLVLLMNGGDGGATGRLFWQLWDDVLELMLETR